MTDLSLQRYTHPLAALNHADATSQQGVGAEIIIDQLDKFYADVQVLENLNLHIQPGEFVAVVGRSGCGKSTLLRLIADLEQPSQGEIRFKSAHRQSETVGHHDIRVMFQDPRLLPWKNILHNIQLGLASQQHAKAQALLDQVGLTAQSEYWPSQLSGGQRQRAALARALSHTPKILLLDEPLGALDALTRLEMQTLIEQLWQMQGFTAILVTHDVSEAVKLADRIILLNRGHIAQQFQVNLPRPRHNTAQFAHIESAVLDAVLAT